MLNKMTVNADCIFLGGNFPYTIGRLSHGHHCRPDLVAVSNPHSPR